MTEVEALQAVLAEHVGRGLTMSVEDLHQQSGVGPGVISNLRNGTVKSTSVGAFFAVLRCLPKRAQVRFWLLQGLRAPRPIRGIKPSWLKLLALTSGLTAKIAAALARGRICPRRESEIRKDAAEVAAELNVIGSGQ